MSLAILFHFLCAQHVSDINISIIRSLRLCCWLTTSVVLFSVRCVLEIWCGWFWVVFFLQAEAQLQPATQRTENKTTDVLIQQHSRKLLMMDILMSEICWAHKKWNKIASDIKLVFHSSTITMMHGPININVLYGWWVYMSTFTLLCTYPVTHPKYRVLFHAEYSCRQVRLTAYRHLIPRLTVRGAVRPPDLRVHGIVHYGQGNFN